MYIMYDKRGMLPSEYKNLTRGDKDFLKAVLEFEANEREKTKAQD